MFTRIVLKRGVSREGESPFWISYSDLMTALMALFLLVMTVTLVSVTREVSSAEQRKIQREQDISELMAKIKDWSRQFPQVKVNETTFRIDLGDVVRFDSGSAVISPTGASLLRAYVPLLLQAQRTELGRQWIRRIVVEGFTDTDGTYLFNLGLSLRRSQGVVCVLFEPPLTGERALSDEEKRQIRDLFLVGGYSFNSMKGSKEESRRVELKIDFWAIDEQAAKPPASLDGKDFGRC
jgi:outer membrane protein OmpA-like peptidoglycan-associated protein